MSAVRKLPRLPRICAVPLGKAGEAAGAGAVGAVCHHELVDVGYLLCPPELKVRAPAHTKQLGWYVEF